ncbi:MAG: hypothetical protein IT440_02805 [Phycisphaeraceae bacterium]|nr:hypothetical protein [Phycisphaeraceae bacterium]
MNRSRRGLAFTTHYPGREMGMDMRIEHQPVAATPVLETYTYPSSWQAWRVAVPAMADDAAWEATLSVMTTLGVTLQVEAYFIPASTSQA